MKVSVLSKSAWVLGVFGLLVGLMVNTVAAATVSNSLPVNNEPLFTVSKQQVIPVALGAAQSEVVLHWQSASQSTAGLSVAVFMNGQYVGPLSQGQYASIVVCAGENVLELRQRDALRQRLLYREFDIKPRATEYLSLQTQQDNTLAIEAGVRLQSTDREHNAVLNPDLVSRLVAQENCAALPKESIASIEMKILFEFDQSSVRSPYYSEIARVAEFMRLHPDTVATIEGHTDNRGSAAYNLALSERRAKAVRDLLISEFGISPQRLRAQGFGLTRPVADNQTASGRALNRRVVAEIYQTTH